MDQALTGWSDPADRLNAVLENDELELYCQPIRGLIGAETYPMAEVLVRMREEEKALLPPGLFLPLFEHHRMMPHLNRWVLRKAAAHLSHGSKIPRLTLNLSGQTIDDAAFPDFVAGEVRAAGIGAGAVLFEIDEADLIARPQASSLLAAALNRGGSGVVLDSWTVGQFRARISFFRSTEDHAGRFH